MTNIASGRIDLVRAALLGAAALGVFHAAVACGRVQANDTGSETHWLARCDSDLDCAEGSCECGVCSRPCDAVSDCSELGVSAVACTAAPSACDESSPGQGGTAPAMSAGACLVPCTEDADCAELGGEAACRAQRCERPNASINLDGVGGQSGIGGAAGSGGGTSSGGQGGSSEQFLDTTLCDGSDDVRLAYVVGGGFVDPYYEFLSDPYGHTSFVIDGQCRFWHTRASDGWVYTGTLDAGRAQRFADAIGYGRLSDYSAFEDSQCDDGTVSTLSAPAGQIRCSCQCTTNADAPAGWREAFRVVSAERADLFGSGETVTGPARLVLLTPMTMNSAYESPAVWPLERPPSASETLPNDGSVFLAASSGVLIEDPAELAALRELRAILASSQVPSASSAPFPVVDIEPQPFDTYDLFLRDEVPEKVRAALARAMQ